MVFVKIVSMFFKSFQIWSDLVPPPPGKREVLIISSNWPKWWFYFCKSTQLLMFHSEVRTHSMMKMSRVWIVHLRWCHRFMILLCVIIIMVSSMLTLDHVMCIAREICMARILYRNMGWVVGMLHSNPLRMMIFHYLVVVFASLTCYFDVYIFLPVKQARFLCAGSQRWAYTSMDIRPSWNMHHFRVIFASSLRIWKHSLCCF